MVKNNSSLIDAARGEGLRDVINTIVDSIVGIPTRRAGTIAARARDLARSDRLDERGQKRVVHEFEDDTIGVFKPRWMRRRLLSRDI
jgi:hypothetical protein